MATPLFDCHAHICDRVFDDDRDQVLARAREQGVVAILSVSESAADFSRVFGLAEGQPQLKAAVGLHPEAVSRMTSAALAEELDALSRALRDRSEDVVAVGEIGLDFSPRVLADGHGCEEEIRERQRAAFREQVQLAGDLGLPVSVHSRSAGRHAIAALAECGARSVCLHAFDGRSVYAKTAAGEHGYKFSVPPSIVRSPAAQKLVRALPLGSLLLESDAPALPPEKGARNEPANVLLSLDMIAALHAVPKEQVAAEIYRTSRQLFPRAGL